MDRSHKRLIQCSNKEFPVTSVKSNIAPSKISDYACFFFCFNHLAALTNVLPLSETISLRRLRLAMRRLRHDRNVPVSRLGTNCWCMGHNKLKKRITKYAFSSRLGLACRRLSPRNRSQCLQRLLHHVYGLWVTVQGMAMLMTRLETSSSPSIRI